MPAMEALKEIFFESPFYVYVVLAAAELVLAVMYFGTRSRNRLRLLLVPPALAVLVFTVERLVVTDREQILADTNAICEAIKQNRIDDVAPYLSDGVTFHAVEGVGDFGLQGHRNLVISMGTTFLRVNPVSEISFTKKPKIEVNGKFARMHAATLIRFGNGAGPAAGQSAAVQWDLLWIKVADNWLIDEITPKYGVEF